MIGRVIAAAGSAAWLLSAATLAHAQSVSEQQLHDRLLGIPAAQPRAVEAEQSITGVKTRGFSLVQPDVGGGSGRKAKGPRTYATPTPVVRTVEPAAAGCNLTDSAGDGGANLCVTFALNSAELTPQSRAMLDLLAQTMQSQDLASRELVLEGYADATGAEARNLQLSHDRAVAVRAYLSSRGVPAARLSAAGFGSSRFLPNRPQTDASNRRVEARLRR